VRTQHAVGRAIIRLIGAEATGFDPQRLVVTVSEAGKPYLADVPELHVSVAHTGDVVVVADCRSAPVGVDIEPALTTIREPRRLAQRLFAEAEVAALRDVPDADLADWFSSVWTIKEAVGKALGVGMIPALSGTIVEGRSEGFALTAVWTDPPAELWTVHQLIAPGGSEKIAIAVPAPGVALGSVSELTLEAFSSVSS
jgi:4'-phosphopantetheinyl transferase